MGGKEEGAKEDGGGLGSSVVHGDLERREGSKRKEDNMA